MSEKGTELLFKSSLSTSHQYIDPSPLSTPTTPINRSCYEVWPLGLVGRFPLPPASTSPQWYPPTDLLLTPTQRSSSHCVCARTRLGPSVRRRLLIRGRALRRIDRSARIHN